MWIQILGYLININGFSNKIWLVSLKMVRFFKILLFLFLLMPLFGWAQSIDDIRKQKAKSEKEISYLNKLLEESKNDKSVSLQKLTILQAKIVQSKKILEALNDEVNYLQKKISDNESRIAELNQEKLSMLDLYAKLIYGTWKKRNKAEKIMFIFSSSDFNQAYNRFKYFQQIQEYSKRQLGLIEQVNDSLDLKNKELQSLTVLKNRTLSDINNKNKDLESEQTKEKQYISELQGKEKILKKKLETENQNQKKLTKELSRMIASQIKKSGSSTSAYKLTPEEKLISDDFAKNKGKLPWPVVEGFISEKFGIRRSSKHVVIENPGINIVTSKNADVRAVFGGVVSEILFALGNNNVVMIRHGNYFSVYVNLAKVYVNKGQKVNTKDIIGKLAFDTEKGSVLNFQLFENQEKQNPELWLAK